VLQDWLKAHAKYGEGADPAAQLSLGLFEQVIDALEKQAGDSSTLPSLSEASRVVADRTGLQRTGANSTVDDVYTFWKRKRERLRKPLLRRFWTPTSENNTDPHATFRQRSKERYKLRRTRRSDDMASYRKLAQVRHSTASAVALLELVEQRETAKLELARIATESFEQAVFEATDTTGTVRRPPVLERRKFAARVVTAATTRQRQRKRKGQRQETRTTSAATAAARGLYAAVMEAHNPAKHAERVASLRGIPSQQASQHGADAASGKAAVPFRTGPWAPPFFTPAHPAAGLAFTRWPLAPTAGDPDASRVGHSDGEIEDVVSAAALLAAAPDGAPTAAPLATLQAHAGMAAHPPPHALSVHAGVIASRRAVSRLRDRGSSAPFGMGGTGAGEAEADVLGMGAVSGLPVGFERDDELVGRLTGGEGTGEDADTWLQQRKSALHVDTTARLRALMLQHRTTNVKPTLGMAAPGSAWEEAAGLALGVGSLGDHGEGWDLTGHRPQARAPDLVEASEWRMDRSLALSVQEARRRRRTKEAEASAAVTAVQGKAQSSGDQKAAREAVQAAKADAEAVSAAAVLQSNGRVVLAIAAGPGRACAGDAGPDDGGAGSPTAATELSWEEEEASLFAELAEHGEEEEAARAREAEEAEARAGAEAETRAARLAELRSAREAEAAKPRGRAASAKKPARKGARAKAAAAAPAPEPVSRPAEAARRGALPSDGPAPAARLLRSERTRHAAAAARDQARPAAAPAPSSAGYITRARLGRNGRVWVDRVRAPPGSDLWQRRRAGISDVAARDAVAGQLEAESASAGGHEAIITAMVRSSGQVPPMTGQLAAAVWHPGSRHRAGDDPDEHLGLSAGLDAPEPGLAHAATAMALGPAAVAAPPSGFGADASEASAASAWQVRTRFLEEPAALLVGGASSGTVGGGTSAEAGGMVAGGAFLAGSHGGQGQHLMRRLAGLAGARLGPAATPAMPGHPASDIGSVRGVGRVAGTGLASDMASLGMPSSGSGAGGVDARAWPWLAGVVRRSRAAPHLDAASVTSHTGLLAHRLGSHASLQHTKPARARRLDQVYLDDDNASASLVEALDASRSELTHAAGTPCPGGVGAPAAHAGVRLRLSRDGEAIEADAGAPATLDDDESYWAAAVRGARPATLHEQAQLLTKAAVEMS